MKKKTLALLLSLALLLTACAAAPVETTAPPTTIPETTAPLFDLAAYKSTVDEAFSDLCHDANVLQNIVAYYVTYGEALQKVSGIVSSEKLREKGLEWIEEQIGETAKSIDDAYNQNASRYKEIIMTEIDGKEAAEIERIYRELFEAYQEMYRTAVNPGSDVQALKEKHSELADIFIPARDELEIFLTE